MGSSSSSSSSGDDSSEYPFKLTDDEWHSRLSRREYKVLRKKGTEHAGSGIYEKHSREGTYTCRGCGHHLYTSQTKFDSGSGWPAFYDSIDGAVKRRADGFRTEAVCANCGGHLGHVFTGEGFKNPTNERHCVNSVCLGFLPASTSKTGKDTTDTTVL